MKQTLILVLSFFITLIVSAQTISYTYDASGNRIKRSVITLRSAVAENEKPEPGLFCDSTVLFNMNVYPNPTHGELKVQLKGKEETLFYELSLYNNAGVLITRQKGTKEYFSLDLSDKPKGLYLLRIRCKGEIQEWKIIRE